MKAGAKSTELATGAAISPIVSVESDIKSWTESLVGD